VASKLFVSNEWVWGEFLVIVRIVESQQKIIQRILKQLLKRSILKHTLGVQQHELQESDLEHMHVAFADFCVISRNLRVYYVGGEHICVQSIYKGPGVAAMKDRGRRATCFLFGRVVLLA
jgi:hypothetical protein